MGLSTSHILLLILVAVLVFGAGKLPQLMTDFAKGLKAFKKGLHEEVPSSKRVSKAPAKKSKTKTAKR